MSRRILIIEDNRDSADTLAYMLQAMGHETAVAYTGPDGLRSVIDWRPDVVLCDIGLPGMIGYEIVRAIRQNPITQKVLLIAVTGYGSDFDKQLAKDAGFDFHFTKPVDVMQLLPLFEDAGASPQTGAKVAR
jgi:CheY-like chemotaxis protein